MKVWFCLFLYVLHCTEGCNVSGHDELNKVTGYTGGSVLLPCSCTEPQSTVETFTWIHYYRSENRWIKVLKNKNYTNRLKWFHERFPANLSLLISDLRKEDEGDYNCQTSQTYTFVRVTIKGCDLDQNEQTIKVKGHSGESVVLPCSCTELQAKPEQLTWTFTPLNPRTNPEEIYPHEESERHTGRVKLLNENFPGNLSLQIFNLTKKDQGEYHCSVSSQQHVNIRLSVQGCDLDQNKQTIKVTGHSGESVVLPCSSTELQAKPEQLTWTFTPLNPRTNPEEIYPHEESERHTGRVKLLNENFPGNLSLQIFNLTKKDQGEYHCSVSSQQHVNIRLSVQGCDLDQNKQTIKVTGHSGESVVLPCSSTELQAKPEQLTWTFTPLNPRTNPEEIYPHEESERHTGRVKLLNENFPGNLSLQIFNLTKKDQGEYHCSVSSQQHVNIRLSVQGCDLDQNKQTIKVTGHSGESVVLPCSSTELQAKPEQLTWTFTPLNPRTNPEEIYPHEESERHTGRVKLLNENFPGNLSLQIFNLTKKDQGEYHCSVSSQQHVNIRLSVQGCYVSDHGRVKEVTGYTGGSVLLPCPCADLQSTVKSFIWRCYRENLWTKVFEDDKHKGRLKLFNERSPANLSLLISDLKKMDEGHYRCETPLGSFTDINLKVKGCDLDQNKQTIKVTGHSGESVVLPCTCTELQAKPEQLTWTFTPLNPRTNPEEIYPHEQSRTRETIAVVSRLNNMSTSDSVFKRTVTLNQSVYQLINLQNTEKNIQPLNIQETFREKNHKSHLNDELICSNSRHPAHDDTAEHMESTRTK
ncbi:hypothetical protein Q8A67_000906 [Cirrhinus molitorella]|uniref:Ig-like domain-containing protein n=1 Tax=Cirrhinus molitorella TaxID=172907 RepID=A0AA88QDI3_9TELE|nr:hypothetical protein Q8A67_000906 [Cirrhinus molitorella]